MNLIEQMGGYEKAKNFINGECSDGFDVQGLRDAILEYRRQHNIFEVGDKVVIKVHPFWPEDYMIQTVEQEHIGKWYMSAWRHATDEEIATGKRL